MAHGLPLPGVYPSHTVDKEGSASAHGPALPFVSPGASLRFHLTFKPFARCSLLSPPPSPAGGIATPSVGRLQITVNFITNNGPIICHTALTLFSLNAHDAQDVKMRREPQRARLGHSRSQGVTH